MPTTRRWLAVGLALVFAGALAAPPLAAQEDSSRRVKAKVQPIYPTLAKDNNISGAVRIEVVVAPNGRVKSTKVLGGHPVLVEAALEAVKQWRYEPAERESTHVVEIKFVRSVD